MKLTGIVKDLGICVVCAAPLFLYCALFMMIAG